MLSLLVVGYVVDALGVDWSWLDGWGVDAFEIVTGGLCILKAADPSAAAPCPCCSESASSAGPRATSS